MKKTRQRIAHRLLTAVAGVCVLCGVSSAPAQEIRWLRIGSLQSPVSALLAEYETEFNLAGTTSNYFSWPAQYGISQDVSRMKATWIACKSFDDPVVHKIVNHKVVGSGPKSIADPFQIFPVEIKLVAKTPHPQVLVDDAHGSAIERYDLVDEYDPNLPCDRMVVVRCNTSAGVSVTKKVMAFANSGNDNYFINEYTFVNTGIVDGAGTVHSQTLDSVWFYYHYRYGFAGASVGSNGQGSTWGGFNSVWGENNLTHSFGEDPSAPAFTNAASPMYHMRGFYMWPGPYNGNPRTPNIPFVEDWGCPKIDDPGSGTLGQAKFAGTVTLHADTSPQNPADDISQPRTTWYISPDITINAATSPSQYDEVFMNDRWAAITEGHPLPGQQHDVLVGDRYANSYVDSRRQAGGGVAQGQGFGPYRLAPGDSVHIVFAEGVSGISWEKGREVGSNWLQYKNHTGTPALVMPGGATTVDQNAYKKAWFYTGVDSILKTYRNAQNTWAHIEAGTNPPQPPDAPSSFTVLSGGDRIQLAWAGNAASNPHFGGYVIYRAKGKVLDWDVSYERIYETSSAITSYDDTSATRGFDYYYYIQSKDDGTQIPGTILYSSQTLTVTSAPALLGRPAGTALQAVRVVPNPYDIRARAFQFGATSQYDRIAFYGLPPGCLVKIYTESGELIYQKVHTRPVGDEVWDSKTSSGQIIVSGVYILYVEVTQDTYDTWDRKDGRLLYRKGESVFRKFVVIR